MRKLSEYRRMKQYLLSGSYVEVSASIILGDYVHQKHRHVSINVLEKIHFY